MKFDQTDFEQLFRNTINLAMESQTIESVREKMVAVLLNEITELNGEVADAVAKIATMEEKKVRIGDLDGVEYCVNTQQYYEIKEMISEGKKIAAIKLFRSISNLGLKEAKEMIERFTVEIISVSKKQKR